MEKEIEQLKEEIKVLKKQVEDLQGSHTHIHHHYAPNGGYIPQSNYQNPILHWHNGSPCYRDPCVRC